MYWKYSKYYDTAIMSQAATWKEKLPDTGLLSAVILDLESKNVSGIQTLIKPRLIDHITKIEVTNGADKTMMSLTGQQLKAVNFYDERYVDNEMAILYGTETQRTDVTIPFGRFLKDKDYMLDLSEWDSVYLEVTNDTTTSYCLTDRLKMDVNLLLAEEAVAPASYIKNYQWRAEKPSADAQHVYHDLPTTELIRRVMVQFDPDLVAGTGLMTNDPGSYLNELKFSYLNQKEMLIETELRDLYKLNAMDYGPVETVARYPAQTSMALDLAVGYVSNMTAYGAYDGTMTTAPAVNKYNSNDRFIKLDQVAGHATIIDLLTRGVGYYQTVILFDAKRGPEEEYLNPKKEAGGKGTVRLDWKPNKDDHTVRTCLSVPIAQGEH